MGLPRWASGKEPTCQGRRHKERGSISGSGRFPGVRNGNSRQYSCLENSMDREAWGATVHRIAESDTTEYRQRQRKRENLGVIPGLSGRNVQKILLSRFHSCWEKRWVGEENYKTKLIINDNRIIVFCMSLVLFSESRHILSENRFYIPAIKRYNYKNICHISKHVSK